MAKSIKDKFLTATYSGRIDEMELLMTPDNCELLLSESACCQAALGGSKEVLVWLNERGFPWDVEVYDCAVSNGHYHLLEWLKINGCPMDRSNTDIPTNAVYSGNLDSIRWLRENEYEWNSYAIVAALHINRSDIFEYLVSNGCPVDEKVYAAASSKDNTVMLDWLKNHCYDMKPYFDDMATTAMSANKTDPLTWLKDNGFVPINEGRLFCVGFEYESYQALDWLIANGWKPDDSLSHLIEKSMSVDAYEWATTNGCSFNRDKCLEYANNYRYCDPNYQCCCDQSCECVQEAREWLLKKM